MSDLSIAGWLVLVVAYVAIGRFRGSSWRSIVRMPIMILATVLIEFAVPALMARHGDLRILAISMAVLAFGMSWGAWRTLAASETSSQLGPEPTASG